MGAGACIGEQGGAEEQKENAADAWSEEVAHVEFLTEPGYFREGVRLPREGGAPEAERTRNSGL